MMSIDTTATPRITTIVIMTAMNRTAVWAHSRFLQGLTSPSTTRSL